MFRSIRLQNFRSYPDATFEFGTGVNVIVGPNASGKTNLLEALYLLLAGSSFRSDDASLIRHGKPWARIDGVYADEEHTLKFEQAGRLKKTRLRNDKPHKNSPGSVVLFEPDQLRMLHGPPELRRAWLDSFLLQLDPEYGQALRNYQRALRQRNVLLRNPQAKSDDYFVWEIKLSEYGGELAAKRRELIEWLSTRLNDQYGEVSGSPGKIDMSYQTPLGESYASDLLKGLAQSRGRDRERGFTALGPHRDGVLFTMEDSPLAEMASRGERRSVYVSLKFLELMRLEEKRGAKATLLLDDLFGELDDRRKRYLQRALADNQIIITSTDDHPIASPATTAKRVIRLSNS